MSEESTIRRQAEALFLRALEVAPPERPAFLEESTDDEAVRAEVDELLALDEEGMGNFLQAPDRSESVENAGPGSSVGPYEVQRKLGEGAFGDVYLAEQREPVSRSVALKILKPGMDSRQIVARFESERQTLAKMAHPHIAAVIDGGTSPSGQPYFVMEYVPGRSITRYCDDKGLDTIERLKLFQQVCSAIQHAHYKGIVHRDIKPSNVLVVEVDGAAAVKVIDFGIAKAIEEAGDRGPGGESGTRHTLLTREGQLVGTPEYMSPEQAELSGRGVDTRTDVYALGLLMYELLTGALPFDELALRQAGLAEILRIIREDEPPRPSTRLDELERRTRTGPTAGGPRRSATAGELRGDLDWITLKAMAKEVDRRYATVSEFAADIDRHLCREPVEASPPSVVYRLDRFLRRNKLLVSAITAVVVALLAGVAGTTVAWLQAREQQALAERRFEEVRRLANTFIFDFHDRILDLPGTTAAREFVVETGLGFIDRLALEAGDDLSLQKELVSSYRRFGNLQGNPTYANRGDLHGALTSYRKALRIIQRIATENPADLGARRQIGLLRYKIAQVFVGQGLTSEALDTHLESLATARELLRIEPQSVQFRKDLAWSLVSTAELQRAVGDIETAMRNAEEALEVRTKILESDPASREARREVMLSQIAVGMGRLRTGERERAETCYRAALELGIALHAQEPGSSEAAYDLALCHSHLGNIHAANARYEEALERYKSMNELHARSAAADPSDSRAQFRHGISLMKIGQMYAMKGDVPAALASYRQALELREAMAAREPSSAVAQRALLASSSLIGDMHTASNEPAEALLAHERSVEIARKLVELAPEDAGRRRDLAIALLKVGECHETLAGDGSLSVETQREHRRQALEWYQESLKRNRERQEKGTLSPDVGIIEDLEKRIAAFQGPQGKATVD